MKVLKGILEVIADILIFAIFAVSLFVIVSSISQKKTGVPNVLGYNSAVVQTDSMEPTIMAGDVVIGRVVDADTTISENDIVTFYEYVDDTMITITHRVIAVHPNDDGLNYYQTQGDNEELPDTTEHLKKDMISVYQFRIPIVGKVIDFIKEPLGFVLCLVIPITAFIIYQIYTIIRLYVEHKKETILEEAKDKTSDDVKDAIIKEYLESLKAKGEDDDPPDKTESNERSDTEKEPDQTETEKTEDAGAPGDGADEATPEEGEKSDEAKDDPEDEMTSDGEASSDNA